MIIVGKKNYTETVKICVSEGDFASREDIIERLCTAEYVGKVDPKNSEYVHDKETKACENMIDFLDYYGNARYRFDDIGHTTYRADEGVVVISPRAMKFREIMPESSLEAIITLSYIRACGYKEVYNSESYGKMYSRLLELYEGATVTYMKDRQKKTMTIIDKPAFEKLIQAEFKVEVEAWTYVFNEIKKCQDAFVMDEVFKMGEYYMQKKIVYLDKVRKQGTFTKGMFYDLGEWTFKCKE